VLGRLIEISRLVMSKKLRASIISRKKHREVRGYLVHFPPLGVMILRPTPHHAVGEKDLEYKEKCKDLR